MLDSKNALELLSAARLPFWEEPGRFGYHVFLRVRRFGHRVLLRVFPLVRKLGQMLLQLLAVRNLFLGQWRLKRFWRRSEGFSSSAAVGAGVKTTPPCCRWHCGLLERNSPCLSQILSIFFFCPPLQEILFSFLELFLPATLDLLSMFQGLCHPL